MHFQSSPQSMAHCMQLRVILNLLHKVFEPQYEEPNVQIKVIYGIAFVNIYLQRALTTFGQYHCNELVKVIYLFLRELIEWILFLTGILWKTLRRRPVEAEEKESGLILDSAGMWFFSKRQKRGQHLKISAKMYKVWKYFEKGQPHVCDYCTHETTRIWPGNTHFSNERYFVWRFHDIPDFKAELFLILQILLVWLGTFQHLS